MSIIPTKFEVDMTIHCRVIAFLSADTSRDFVTLTFDLEQLLCMAGHVPNLATKLEDRISSWFMSHKVSRWLPLRMRTRPLCMRRITWPVSRGLKPITFLEPPNLICLFTMHFRWLYDECNVIGENNASRAANEKIMHLMYKHQNRHDDSIRYSKQVCPTSHLKSKMAAIF